MTSPYRAPRISSPQLMALMRRWPNIDPAHTGRGVKAAPSTVPAVQAAPEKDGTGGEFGLMARRAYAGGRHVPLAESQNVRVTYKRRRHYTVQ